MKDRIQRIEGYVRQTMEAVAAPDLRIAHDFDHVDRVRCWALAVAATDGKHDPEIVEATALLHDIGLTCIQAEQRDQHGHVGAEIASRFLSEQHMFPDREIARIVEAIRAHNAPCGGGALGEILRDADKLDALGAVGIMRAFTSNYAKPEYPPRNPKGTMWELPMAGFEERFAHGQGIGDYIVDQINFQISFYDELCTETARQIGKPLVDFMKAYVIQLEREVHLGTLISGRGEKEK